MDAPKPYTISGTKGSPIGALSSSLISPSPFKSLYLISPGRYAFSLDENPLNCSVELSISDSSINKRSATYPLG